MAGCSNPESPWGAERWPREVGGRGGEREGAVHAARQPGGSPGASKKSLTPAGGPFLRGVTP